MYNYHSRDRAVSLYHRRKSLHLLVKDVLSIFSISKQTLYNWIKSTPFLNENCNIIHRNSLYYKSCANQSAEYYLPKSKYYEYIATYVNSKPQFIIKDLLRSVNELFGISVCRQTIYNILKRHKITHKKIQINSYPYEIEKFNEAAVILKNNLSRRKKRIISIDEVGINLSSINSYGWNKSGQRCIIKNSGLSDRNNYSLLFGISRNKIVNYKLKKGGINGVDFAQFMQGIHNNNGRYYYLMDNARIHKSKLISAEIKSKIIYNVPYSPQFNPIELVNNELKRQIKGKHLNNITELENFIKVFIKNMNKKKYNSFFDHSFNLLGI
jgi:hypothetical protein